MGAGWQPSPWGGLLVAVLCEEVFRGRGLVGSPPPPPPTIVLMHAGGGGDVLDVYSIVTNYLCTYDLYGPVCKVFDRADRLRGIVADR